MSIVAFSNSEKQYRTATYLTKRHEFRPNSIGVVKVLASKYPVSIDVIFPLIPRTISLTVTNEKPIRIKSFLMESCEVRIDPLEEVSAVFLASTMEEIPV